MCRPRGAGGNGQYSVLTVRLTDYLTPYLVYMYMLDLIGAWQSWPSSKRVPSGRVGTSADPRTLESLIHVSTIMKVVHILRPGCPGS